MAVRKPTRRRLDVDERRAAILAAARELFAGGTYAEVSVAQVGQAADASPALVFHYFGSKSGLYGQVVSENLELLAGRIAAADGDLPPSTSARDRVRNALWVYLDHIAGQPRAWASRLIAGDEPQEAVQLRRAAEREQVAALRAVLAPSQQDRHEFALRGFFGFLEAVCLAWVERGCPESQRPALVDAAVGALEGALGDWSA